MPSTREERIGREAAQWVVLFDGPTFKPADVRGFRRWLHKSPEHRPAFQLASRTWNQLDLLSKLESFPLPAEGAFATRRRLLIGGGVLGVAAAIAGGFAFFGSDAAIAYETSTGQQRQISLPDGTVVALDAGTRIEAVINEHKRHVRVVRGEALFTLAARPEELFYISTDAGDIGAGSGEVLVKVLPQGARVSVFAGAVHTRAKLPEGVTVITANPGQEISLRGDERDVSLSSQPLIAQRTLWREGRLAFDNTPLPEALADVSRQTGTRFALADKSLEALHVGGLVNARDLEGFLTLLRQNLAVDATRRDDDVLVLSALPNDATMRAHPLP